MVELPVKKCVVVLQTEYNFALADRGHGEKAKIQHCRQRHEDGQDQPYIGWWRKTEYFPELAHDGKRYGYESRRIPVAQIRLKKIQVLPVVRTQF